MGVFWCKAQKTLSILTIPKDLNFLDGDVQ